MIDQPVTLAVPLGKTALSGAQGVVVTTGAGGSIPTQWDVLTTWRGSSNVSHGLVTFLTPQASNAGTYNLVTGQPLTGAAVTKADITSTAFDAVISVNVSGTVYSISAADLLGTITPRKDYTHASGPLMSSFCVGHPLLVNGSGAEHPSLQGHFEIRGYKISEAVSKVWVSCTLENTGCFTTPSAVTGDVVVSLQGQADLQNKPGFNVGADYRFVVDGWWGGDPGIYTALEADYIESTELVPKYRDITLSESDLNGLPQSTDWRELNVISQQGLDGGGDKPELAPMPAQDVRYLISDGDQRAYNHMRAYNRELGWLLRIVSTSNVSFCWNARDEATGFPVSIETYPDLAHVDRGLSGGNLVQSRGSDVAGSAPVKTDGAHAPQPFYVEYLVTGHFHLLEGMQFWGTAHWLGEDPGPSTNGERTWPRGFYEGQVRSLGWGLRNTVNAAVATPDAHPLKGFLDDAVQYALDSAQADLRPLDLADSTGLVLTEGIARAIAYPASDTRNPNDSGNFVGVGTWMDDYYTWAMSTAIERGWTSPAWAWKSQASVGRFDSVAGHCWDYAPYFALGVRDTQSDPIYTTWAEMFSKNSPGVSVCAVSGSPMTPSNVERHPSDYAPSCGPALAACVSLGIPGAAAAWALYDARDVSSWVRPATERPEWQVVPR